MFGKDEKDKGDKLQKIRSALSGASGRDLRVVQKGDTYEIHGEVDSIAEKQSVFSRVTETAGDVGVVNKLEIGTVPKGKPDTEARPAGASISPDSDSGARIHEVEAGDTLSHIAKRYYGDSSKYRKIFDANRDQLDDPDLIKVGQKLRIPD